MRHCTSRTRPRRLVAIAAVAAPAAGVTSAQALAAPPGGETSRVSVAADGAEADGQSDNATMTPDAAVTAFHSLAGNLVPGDTNGRPDVFVRDQATGVVERVSVRSDGSQATGPTYSYMPALSDDGRIVAFQSISFGGGRPLVADDTNDVTDVYVHDRDTGVTERVSVTSTGEQADERSEEPDVSADGRYVAFQSYADNLVAGDTNRVPDIFVRDLVDGTTRRVSVDANGNKTDDASYRPAISAAVHRRRAEGQRAEVCE